MIIFILIGGAIIQCVINTVSPGLSYCNPTDYRMFGALASMGALELIYEAKHIMAIFQKKNDIDVDDEGEDTEE